LELLQSIKLAIIGTSIWEIIAVCSGITYIILAAKEKIACWLFAAISVLLYIYLTFTAKLYLESVLQFFYLYMAYYGFITWKKGTTTAHTAMPVTVKKINWHILYIGISLGISISFGYVLTLYTDAASPYLDAFSSVFALGATWMQAKKLLENWVYWIAIDSVNVFLYSSRDLHLTSLLYALYVLLCLVALSAWYKSYMHAKKIV
jgi:nicotinamide mononucleotide transporter